MPDTQAAKPTDEYGYTAVGYWARRLYSSLFYFRLWRSSHADAPYYAPKAIERIESLMPPAAKVFEWGSGASTLWWGRHAGEAVAVEHDEGWYRKGVSAAEEMGLDNVTLYWEPPSDEPLPASWERGGANFSVFGEAPAKPEFYRYFSKIDKYPDGYFDIISIDGRERIACLVHALPKLKEHGLIVLDDSNRTRYQPFFELLKDWRIEKYDIGLVQTTLFIRDEH